MYKLQEKGFLKKMRIVRNLEWILYSIEHSKE